MTDRNEPITVRILDRDYRVMCDPDERRALMDSALTLDQQMRAIRDSGRVSSVEKIAVMCALNLAEDNRKLRDSERLRQKQVDSPLSMMADRLDQILQKD